MVVERVYRGPGSTMTVAHQPRSPSLPSPLPPPFFCRQSCSKVAASWHNRPTKMASVQLLFTLPGFGAAGAVQQRGSWDGYSAYYPLAKDESSTVWETHFLLPSSLARIGITSGYLPPSPPPTEPKIGNNVSIVYIPRVVYIPRQSSIDVPKGRPLSPSQIVSPKPQHPSPQLPYGLPFQR